MSEWREDQYPPDSEIDFSDIPELTPEQLRNARRAGRPPEGSEAKQMIAIRIDQDLLAKLKALAKKRKIGYQTLIQELLVSAIGL